MPTKDRMLVLLQTLQQHSDDEIMKKDEGVEMTTKKKDQKWDNLFNAESR